MQCISTFWVVKKWCDKLCIDSHIEWYKQLYLNMNTKRLDMFKNIFMRLTYWMNFLTGHEEIHNTFQL